MFWVVPGLAHALPPGGGAARPTKALEAAPSWGALRCVHVVCRPHRPPYFLPHNNNNNNNNNNYRR